MAIPAHRQHLLAAGLGEAVATLGLSLLLPSRGKGWAVQYSGDSAHSSVSSVLGSLQTQATPCPCSHHVSRVPSPAHRQRNSGATSAGPVAPVRGMVTGSVGSSLFHSRADESLDKNAARFWVDLF